MTGLPSAEPRTVAEAIAVGHQQPHTSNPFLWSSTFRETFNFDRCLSDAGSRRLSQWGGLGFQISLHRHGGFLFANR